MKENTFLLKILFLWISFWEFSTEMDSTNYFIACVMNCLSLFHVQFIYFLILKSINKEFLDWFLIKDKLVMKRCSWNAFTCWMHWVSSCTKFMSYVCFELHTQLNKRKYKKLQNCLIWKHKTQLSLYANYRLVYFYQIIRNTASKFNKVQ